MAEHKPKQSVRRESSSDALVREVVRGLYEGRFVAGQRLAEPDLMRRYGVSRSTVREALTRLSAEGMVKLSPFRGAEIRQLSRWEAENILTILEMAIGLAARLAARNIGMPGARDYFVHHYDNLVRFAREHDSFDLVRARNRFYRAITRVGNNPDLERLLLGFQVHLIRANLRQPHDERFADYDRMAKAILAADECTAEEAGRLHIRHVAAAVAASPDDTFAATSGEEKPDFNLEEPANA